MISRKLTKIVVISISGLFLLAGGAAHSVNCGQKSCCCVPEPVDHLALQQGDCGCSCGQVEQSQVPEQSAIAIAISDIKPAETKFDYAVKIDNNIIEKLNFQYAVQEISTHSPPLIIDNRYTPLLC